MATYDYESAHKYIQMHSDLIDTVKLGIKEDWYWTAQEVYAGDSFSIDLQTKPEIAGITGSYWATPCMEVAFKDGTEELKDCFTGDVSGQKPSFFSLGCMSQPVQDARDGKLID